MSGVLRTLNELDKIQSSYDSESTCALSRQPFVSFLCTPKDGLPVISDVGSWLNAVEDWHEAAHFMDVPVEFMGIPLLGHVNYNRQLFKMCPRCNSHTHPERCWLLPCILTHPLHHLHRHNQASIGFCWNSCNLIISRKYVAGCFRQERRSFSCFTSTRMIQQRL